MEKLEEDCNGFEDELNDMLTTLWDDGNLSYVAKDDLSKKPIVLFGEHVDKAMANALNASHLEDVELRDLLTKYFHE